MAFVLRIVRWGLGLFFLLTGAVKLSDHISAELHRQMQSQFVQFAEVFPLKEFGYRPEPEQYLTVVGWIEAVAGVLLAVGPQLLQEISNFTLTVIMIGDIYTLLVLKEPLTMYTPATVCLGLLLLLNIGGREGKMKPKFQ
ncbi:transmembrane protein 35B [Microcaecilia unicolor]|uniref:Transmembrane protein 35B n=1 Tax=Microcaecilia unicolor TaxID=1415580 RepID=A0A6P7ZAN4_9AMPH|nr:transmembrane protein 35B [Microcaecilia unicolor]